MPASKYKIPAKRYIITAVISYLTFLDFAFYNALSIKGATETSLWHWVQYSLVIFFTVFGSSFYQIYLNLRIMWTVSDFHEFGRTASIFAVIYVICIPVYVYSLHWLLPIVEGWLK